MTDQRSGTDAAHMSVQKLYGEIWATEDPAFEAQLAASLGPRGFDLMDERFAAFGIQPDDIVLDVGARDARHAIAIVRRHGCRAVATDPVPLHLDLARERLRESEPEVAARVELSLAPIESMPFADGAFAHIWCRDMLNHVGLRRGMAELARLLAADGRILVFQTFATPTMDTSDARRLYETMSIVPENMDVAFFRETVRGAGLVIEDEEELGSEWREARLEAGDEDGHEYLLRISRLRRNEDALVARFGRARFETTLADYLWAIYLILGKLSSSIFVLAHAR